MPGPALDPAVQPQPAVLHHQWTVCVEGVRELEVAGSTVWGEADCFVQYHFPTLPEDCDDATGELECAEAPDHP